MTGYRNNPGNPEDPFADLLEVLGRDEVGLDDLLGTADGDTKKDEVDRRGDRRKVETIGASVPREESLQIYPYTEKSEVEYFNRGAIRMPINPRLRLEYLINLLEVMDPYHGYVWALIKKIDFASAEIAKESWEKFNGHPPDHDAEYLNEYDTELYMLMKGEAVYRNLTTVQLSLIIWIQGILLDSGMQVEDLFLHRSKLVNLIRDSVWNNHTFNCALILLSHLDSAGLILASLDEDHMSSVIGELTDQFGEAILSTILAYRAGHISLSDHSTNIANIIKSAKSFLLDYRKRMLPDCPDILAREERNLARLISKIVLLIKSKL